MMLKHIMIYNNIGSENIWIGIDDTDSITGGCTTYLGCTIIKKLIDENYDLGKQEVTVQFPFSLGREKVIK
jgi:hypothetical protein